MAEGLLDYVFAAALALAEPASFASTSACPSAASFGGSKSPKVLDGASVGVVDTSPVEDCSGPDNGGVLPLLTSTSPSFSSPLCCGLTAFGASYEAATSLSRCLPASVTLLYSAWG